MAMKAYAKGSRAERELIDYFSSHGFSVIRAAGSGVSSLCPDLLAFRHSLHYAFESKAIEKGNLNIGREQFLGHLRWEENTAITTYIAWRRNREDWLFLPLSVFEENARSFSISWEKAKMIGKKKEELV